MPKKPKKPAAPKKPKKATPAWDGAVAASAEAAPGAVVDTSREPVIRHKFKQKLPCRIDDAHVAVKAAELAVVIRERETMLEQKRESNAKYREKINFFDERLQELAAAVEQHTEVREVQCIERLTVTNEVETVRLDTNEVIDRRGADAGDLQDAIYFPDAEDDDVHKPLTDEDLGFDDEPHAADTDPPSPGEHDIDPTSPAWTDVPNPAPVHS